jgi:hypothetical protein
MVGCYLLATRSLFGRYSIATLIFNEFGGGFLENDQGRNGFGLEDRSSCLRPAVRGDAGPLDRWMQRPATERLVGL